jgi:hypothetical protein
VKSILARSGLILVLMLGGVSLAQAQASSGSNTPCAKPGDPSTTLSDKLSQGGGVICPPDVDPGIKAPAPETGKMPVIPPPGSPGGDPNVQPK